MNYFSIHFIVTSIALAIVFGFLAKIFGVASVIEVLLCMICAGIIVIGLMLGDAIRHVS